jgi:hypothetical protein
VLATLPVGEMPSIVDFNILVLISETGLVYVHTAIDRGVMLTLPDEMLAPPDDEEPAAPDDVAATPVAASGDTIVIGDRSAVLRSNPSRDAQILMVLQPGTELEPFGEPIEAGGRTWLPVREPKSGMLGYVRADFVVEPEA